jgi:hypothetical protein
MGKSEFRAARSAVRRAWRADAAEQERINQAAREAWQYSGRGGLPPYVLVRRHLEAALAPLSPMIAAAALSLRPGFTTARTPRGQRPSEPALRLPMGPKAKRFHDFGHGRVYMPLASRVALRRAIALADAHGRRVIAEREAQQVAA